MNTKQPEPMTPFDELTIPKQLRFMKLLLPFMPASTQHMLGIFIKFLELRHTIYFFQSSASSLDSIFNNKKADINNPADFLEVLFPYLSSDEIQTANSFRSLMNTFEMIQAFSQSEKHNSDSSSANPFEMMMSMLSPEQQEMFQTYQTMFSDLDSENTQ